MYSNFRSVDKDHRPYNCRAYTCLQGFAEIPINRAQSLLASIIYATALPAPTTERRQSVQQTLVWDYENESLQQRKFEVDAVQRRRTRNVNEQVSEFKVTLIVLDIKYQYKS